MGDDGKKKKLTILGLSSILLVAAVVGTVVGVKKMNESDNSSSGSSNQVTTSNKAATAFCKPTDFKETCEQSLSSANSSDPKELMKVAFQYTVKKIEGALQNSSVLEAAAKDPRTSHAFETCKEVLNDSIDDLKRAFDQVGTLDIAKTDEYIDDLKTWLSATVTYHETCLDAFENTTGDSGEKMKKLLKTSGELLSNSLAMLEEASKIVDVLGLSSFQRRLLQETSHDDYQNYPAVRRLLQERSHEDYPNYPPVRRLLQERSHEDYPNYPPVRRLLQERSHEDYPNYPPVRRLLQERSHEDYPNYPPVRRLFQERSHEDYPNYPPARRLFQESSHEDYPNYPSWTEDGRRAILQADPKTIKPNAVVAKDGSGSFKTITDAIKSAPTKSNGTFVILIKQGVYNEYVEVPRHVNGIVFIGEGASKTKITGNKNYIDGIGTYKTATVAVNGERFMARDITFENSAGPLKHQAVALRVSGDRAIFYKCNMDGYQDTLYTHSYRQFYRECNVTGTIDFIFGDAAVVLQKCNLIVRKPLANQACMVTAQGRKDHRSVGGIILQGCKITADAEFMAMNPRPESYLGRPWKEYSRTIIMQSYIDSNISPEGWSPWAGTWGLDTSYYGEFNNNGPASSLAKRVTWKGIKKISPQEAETYTPAKFIQGDMWIKPTGIPYDSGMMKV